MLELRGWRSRKGGCWEEYRTEKLQSFNRSIHQIDPEILPLLNLINSFPDFVTLSSCSGRIVIMDMPDFGNKSESVFLGKWHGKVDLEEVWEAIKKGKRVTWFIMHPPILHVACRDMQKAEEFMSIARKAGFRRAGVISPSRNIVEIFSLEKMEMVVAVNGDPVVTKESLKIQLEFAIEKLERSRSRLLRLENELRRLEANGVGKSGRLNIKVKEPS
jgi:tRNA wybutosine-synthesizing protein 3